MSRKEEVKKAREAIDFALELAKAKKVIKNNYIEFDYNGNKYRVRMPTLEEEELVEKKKALKLNKMLSEVDEEGNPVYLFKKQWNELYKKRGIDLDEKEARIDHLNIEIETLLLELAKTKDKPEIDRIEREIMKRKQDIAETISYILDKYQYCIEYILFFFYKKYLLFLVLEKLENKKWKRVYKTFEDMQKEQDTKLIATALESLSYLVDLRMDNVIRT